MLQKLRYFSLLFILVFNIVIIHAQSNQIDQVIRTIKNDSQYKSAVVEAIVYDVKTGEKLYSTNENIAVAPASITKLFITAASVLNHGNKRLTTRFYTNGEIKDSILQGDLWVRGGGDPTLGSEYYTKEEDDTFLNSWTDSLLKLGIKKIEGNIIGDASEFGYNGVPDGWSWSDMGNAYGAAPTGLAIYDNILRFRFKTGNVGSIAQLTSVSPEVPNLKFYNYINAANVQGDNSVIYGAPYQNERIGSGSLQSNTSIRIRGSLPNPEYQVAYEFYKKLNQNGISVTGQVQGMRDLIFQGNKRTSYDNFKLLFSYNGATIQEIVNMTNHKSVNMFAEQLVSLLSYLNNGNGDYDKGLDMLRKFWKDRINTNGLLLRDGSGLSRSNGISAEHLSNLLNYMYKQPQFQQFYESLPISGKRGGTLENVCVGQVAAGRIHAKSGTMRGIKSYAGYAETQSGKTLSFVIILNNFDGTSYQAVKKIEKFMNVLVTLP